MNTFQRLGQELDSRLRGNDKRLLSATDWVERFLDSDVLKRCIWAVVALSALYFSVIIFDVFTR